jgi:hypothetical protein
MGLKLDVDLSGIEQAAQQISNIEINAADISGASTGIFLIMQQDVDFRFQNAPNTETGGIAWGGEYWLALSEPYLIYNPRRRNSQLLRDTGELMQSVTTEGHPYNVSSVTETGLTFGTTLLKAGRLQRDRPFLYWHPVLLERVAEYLIGWISGEN